MSNLALGSTLMFSPQTFWVNSLGRESGVLTPKNFFFLCEPLKCAAIVWLGESKILMEGTPVAMNQGWRWQAPGVPGLNSRNTDSCWLIRLTRLHENANYLWIVLLSCEDQSNIYPSAFQYSSIPNTWCKPQWKIKGWQRKRIMDEHLVTLSEWRRRKYDWQQRRPINNESAFIIGKKQNEIQEHDGLL